MPCSSEFFERRGGLQEERFHWQVPPGVLQALPFFWGLTEDMEQYRRAVCSLRSVRGPLATCGSGVTRVSQGHRRGSRSEVTT